MNADNLEVVLFRRQRAAAPGQLLPLKVVADKHGGALLGQYLGRICRYLMLSPVGIPVGDNPNRHLLLFLAFVRETRMLSKWGALLRPFARKLG
ncbi:hypothetical protein [Pseudoduganella sp. HUAS MS19]